MQRLPGYDTRTSRAEMTAFLSLGFAVITLIALALFDAARFAENKEMVVAALSNGSVEVAGAQPRKTNILATNLTAARARSINDQVNARATPIPRS